MPSQPSIPRRLQRRGFSAIYTIVAIVALTGMVSFGVEVGRVYAAKGELQTAADAAVRAAGAAMSQGAAAARTAAKDLADDNTCDGTPVILLNSDVEFGSWNSTTKVFTAVTGSAENSATAIRVTARRAASRNTQLSLTFARLAGKNSVDLSASAVASAPSSGAVGGFVGLDSVTFDREAYIASYNSATQPNPSQASSFNHGELASNGLIHFKGSSTVRGNIVKGPSGAVMGAYTITGSVQTLPAPIVAPASPGWNPAANPNGIPQNYTVNSSTTLPGGTYYFTSLTINSTLSFSGSATLYVNGNIAINAWVLADNFNPSRLKIYQIGNRTFNNNSNDFFLVAQVHAPQTTATFNNDLLFYGSALFKSITAKDDAFYFYDEQLGTASAGQSLSIVQ